MLMPNMTQYNILLLPKFYEILLVCPADSKFKCKILEKTFEQR